MPDVAEPYIGGGSGGEDEDGQKPDTELDRDFQAHDPLAARPSRPRLRPIQEDLFQVPRPPDRPAYLGLDR